jgi:hypothetical protein
MAGLAAGVGEAGVTDGVATLPRVAVAGVGEAAGVGVGETPGRAGAQPAPITVAAVRTPHRARKERRVDDRPERIESPGWSILPTR